MNFWLVAATVLLAGGLLPCGWVLVRGNVLEGVVALVLAAASFVGGLVFVRFLGERWL